MEINEFDRRVTTQTITHEDAEKAAERIINSAWRNNGERAKFSIPVHPNDDDIVLMEYIRRQKEDSAATRNE